MIGEAALYFGGMAVLVACAAVRNRHRPPPPPPPPGPPDIVNQIEREIVRPIAIAVVLVNYVIPAAFAAFLLWFT